MKTFKSAGAYTAAGHKSGVPADYMQALFNMTMRDVEFDDTSARAHFTPFRYLELARETDGVLCAWVVGTMEVSGRQVINAVLIGELRDATKVTVTMRRAKSIISEVLTRGSRAATLLAEGTASGRRVFLYA